MLKKTALLVRRGFPNCWLYISIESVYSKKCTLLASYIFVINVNDITDPVILRICTGTIVWCVAATCTTSVILMDTFFPRVLIGPLFSIFFYPSTTRCQINIIIYPIPIYKFKWHIFHNRWQCISNENNSKKCTFPNHAPKGHTDTHQITYIPVREASPNQYCSFYRTQVNLVSDLWVRISVMFVKLNWCDSGWWWYQPNTNW